MAEPSSRPSDPSSGPSPTAPADSPTEGCAGCTISSQTVAKYPTNRARTRIGVGEEVELTVNPGPATWSITSGGGTLSPSEGSNTKVTYIAGDNGGDVTITAKGPGGCSCSIALTVVEPTHWTMTRQKDTGLHHPHAGRPACGWLGIGWVHPDDVNFYNVKDREVDSKYVGTGSYAGFTGTYHGGYDPPERVSDWARMTLYVESRGTTDNSPDQIYTGDIAPAVVGAAPPFNPGSGQFPIVWQWKVRSGKPKKFPTVPQKDRVYADGRCESTKGRHAEQTKYNDPARRAW